MVEAEPLPPLAGGASDEQRAAQYAAVLERLELLLEGELCCGCFDTDAADDSLWPAPLPPLYRRHPFPSRTAPPPPRPRLPRPPGEADWVAAMATVACELHAAFAYFHWTGFYRAAAEPACPAPSASQPSVGPQQPCEQQLVIGPYQGGLGCLRIPFSKGVCGAAARTRQTQLVPDVHAFPGHIACASSTQVRAAAAGGGAGRGRQRSRLAGI